MCFVGVGSPHRHGPYGGGLMRSGGGHRIADINKHCFREFQAHWLCLENNNHKLFSCRSQERPYNSCVLKNLVSSGLSLVLGELLWWEVTLTSCHLDNRILKR